MRCRDHCIPKKNTGTSHSAAIGGLHTLEVVGSIPQCFITIGGNKMQASVLSGCRHEALWELNLQFLRYQPGP